MNAVNHVEGGAQPGATIDWARDVGRLNVRQLRRVLTAVEAGMSLRDTGLPGSATADDGDLLPVLMASPGWAHFLDALVGAAASVAKRPADDLYDLPLDEFIDAVRVIAVAALERNADYIAGPVTEAIQRIGEIAQAVSADRART